MKKLLSVVAALLLLFPVQAANRIKTVVSGETILAADWNNEFNNIYDGTIDRTAGRWGTNDDIPLTFGSAQDTYIEWNTDQTVDHTIVGLGSGLIFSIMEQADMGTDWGIASQTNPALYVHSADATATTDWIKLTHDQTNAVIDVGSGSLTFVDDIILQGTTPLLTVGDAGAEDAAIVFDGNAQDFYMGLDDTADDWVVGLGSAVGTTPAFAVDENQVTTFSQDPVIAGTTPQLTIGDAGAEDTALVYDGNAQDFYAGIDDTDDAFKIGLGSAVGTNPAITVAGDGTENVTLSGDLIASSQASVGRGSVLDYYLFDVAGSFACGGASTWCHGMNVSPALTGANGDTARLSHWGIGANGSIGTQGNSETIGIVSSLYLQEPNITVNAGDTITTAATLYIDTSPTEATQNYSLYVASGTARFDDNVTVAIDKNVALGAGASATLGTIGGSGPATASQNQWLEIEIDGTAHWIPVWQ